MSCHVTLSRSPCDGYDEPRTEQNARLQSALRGYTGETNRNPDYTGILAFLRGSTARVDCEPGRARELSPRRARGLPLRLPAGPRARGGERASVSECIAIKLGMAARMRSRGSPPPAGASLSSWLALGLLACCRCFSAARRGHNHPFEGPFVGDRGTPALAAKPAAPL